MAKKLPHENGLSNAALGGFGARGEAKLPLLMDEATIYLLSLNF